MRVAEEELGRPSGVRLGISLSGGGIRAAAFGLGAVQRLQDGADGPSIFERSRYLSAVSGGGYVAAGLLVAHASSSEEALGQGPPPWARRSPEEEHLRKNLEYMAPGSAGRAWFGLNLAYGLILNLAPLLAGAFIIGRLYGFALSQMHPRLAEGELDRGALLSALLGGSLLSVAALCVVGARRFVDKERFGTRGAGSEWAVAWSTRLLALGVLTWTLFLLGPYLLGRLHSTLTSGPFDHGAAAGPEWWARRLLTGLVLVAVALALGGSAVAAYQRGILPRISGTAAWLAGPLILGVPLIMAAETGAVRPFELQRDATTIGGALLVVVLAALFVHNRRYSMHLLYRERLSQAFVVRRRSVSDGAGGLVVRADAIPYSERVTMSGLSREMESRSAGSGRRRMPRPILCAAVNTNEREVPVKRGADSFTFEPDRCGGALVGTFPTSALEDSRLNGGGELTLPSMMAISGAALSPVMGRFTRPAFRFLMALLNVRLGVWVPNPHRRPAPPLPAPESPGRRKRLWDYFVSGWREPGALYVLREALGRADTRGRFIYLTDGGHWENLGVVELLRRRCTDVYVVDASGNRLHPLADLGRAISLARSELGVEIRIDPRPTLPGDDGATQRPWASGTITYPDGTEGRIYYVRATLWDGAPFDLAQFRALEPAFPRHPTADQFLSGDAFDAYRGLGWAAVDCLLHTVPGTPVELDERDDADASGGDDAKRGRILH